ncbi:fimbria/pilus periplasmic chaperone [Enterobacter ludwigii]|nr:fimbria/pilus periplasmic chaperone [Enterobacter ludwigii]
MSRTILTFLLFWIGIGSLHASMTISGTRIVFPASEKEVNVRTMNKGDLPSLVQVWVDDGRPNEDVNNVKVPFIVTPPVYRVEPKRGQSVRMIFNGMPLPQDQESVFWFNMLEIPPRNASNEGGQKLELAFRTRIKIFYRPVSLEKSNSELESGKLNWKIVRDTRRGIGIEVDNATPYYFSFDGASVVTRRGNVSLAVDMVAPKSKRVFYPEKKLDMQEKISELKFRFLNDYGAPVNISMITGEGDRFIQRP